jgi:hypothetical protein
VRHADFWFERPPVSADAHELRPIVLSQRGRDRDARADDERPLGDHCLRRGRAEQTERDLHSRIDQPFECLRERLLLDITSHRTHGDREQREHPSLVTGDTEETADACRE